MEDEQKIKIRLIQISVTSASNYAIYVRMEFVTPFRIQTEIKILSNFQTEKSKNQPNTLGKLVFADHYQWEPFSMEIIRGIENHRTSVPEIGPI